MNAFKDTEIGEIIKTPQDTSQVSPQVNLQVEMLDRFAIDSRCNFSNKLTITWRLFGESADYLAISELSARLLGHNWVRNGSNRLKIMNFKYSKPQMKTPRVTPLEGVYTYACGHTWVRSREPAGFQHDERRCIVATDYVKTIHRKGRKERKAAQQESLCPLRSLWFNAFSAPAHGRAPPQPAPAVHLRLSRGGMSMEGDFGGGDELIVSSKLIINYRQTVSAESSRFHYIRLMDLRENIVEAY